MAHKNFEIFQTAPDTVEEMFCRVCDTRCNVERSIIDSTCFVEAMAKRGHWHDRFECPHIGKQWHEQALKLCLEIDRTPSKRLAELMRRDLNDILVENGRRPGGS
jgi:hypothetical protein